MTKYSYYAKKNHRFKWRRLHRLAMLRARHKGLPFSIKKEDIVIPTHCPVLGIPLEFTNRFTNNTPTLDRIIPELGYVPGNVIVVSRLANTIKQDATPDQLMKVARFYAKLAR